MSEPKIIELNELVLSTVICVLDKLPLVGYNGTANTELIKWFEKQDTHILLDGINNIIDDIESGN